MRLSSVALRSPLAVCLLLVACGDGGDPAAPPDGSAPAGPDAGGVTPPIDGPGATTPDTATAPRDASGTPPAAGGLTVRGNRIVTSDGRPFRGRGANLHDTRSCNACTAMDPDVTGWKRWADELIDRWGANFVRFNLTSYASSEGYRRQWQSLGVDAGYLADIKAMVTHMTSKPGAYVMVTLFMDPSMKPNNGDYDSEWPTDATMPIYAKLAEALHADPKVLFGLTNEPHGPAERNAELAARYMKAIQTIRTVEASHGSPKHIVVVQAPQLWARELNYFIANPLPGENIAYEIHPYNARADFDRLIVQPSQKLPLIIGEYGPFGLNGTEIMTTEDIRALWTVAKANEIPHVAWNFHQRCDPDMLEDTARDGCGLAVAQNYTFPRTAWGNLFHDYLATPW